MSEIEEARKAILGEVASMCPERVASVSERAKEIAGIAAARVSELEGEEKAYEIFAVVLAMAEMGAILEKVEN